MNFGKKGIGGGAIFAIVLLAVGITFFATGGSLAQIGVGSGSDSDSPVVKASASCNTDKTYALQVKAQNPLNSTGTETLAAGARVYRMDADSEQFVGSTTLNSDGSYKEITTGISCGKEYKIVIAANDGTSVSAVKDAVVVRPENEDTFIDINLAQNNDLSFRVRDIDEDAFLYADTDSSAGTFHNTGSSWYNTTANSTTGTTGKVIGQDGKFAYRIDVEADTSAASDEQYVDPQGKLYVGVNRDDKLEWDTPTLKTTTGGTLSKLESGGAVLERAVADGYDDFWEWSGVVLETGDTEKLELRAQAKSGVNPSDDIVFAVFQSGYYVKTASDAVDLGVQKDDSSLTYVYSPQSGTIVFG